MVGAEKPFLFVGSSVEGLGIANAIQANIDKDFEVARRLGKVG